MAGHAGMLIHLLAARLEFLRGINFSCCCRRYFGRGLLRRSLVSNPRCILFFRQRLDDHGHETVLLAAKLGALTPVDARQVHAEPGVTDESRNGILLYPKLRYPP